MTELAAGPAPEFVDPVLAGVTRKTRRPPCPRCRNPLTPREDGFYGLSSPKLPVSDMWVCNRCGYWTALVNGVRTETGKR